MKLYFHLAWDGIRKNRRLYVPYLLTGVGAATLFYILLALANGPAAQMNGGDSLSLILRLGSFVLAIFSALLLFYTNSFLIRRRNREFALYNVLDYRQAFLSVILDSSGEIHSDSTAKLSDYEKVCCLSLIGLDDYNAMTGGSETLAPNEVLVSGLRMGFSADTLTIEGGPTWRVKAQLTDAVIGGERSADVTPTLYVIVPDLDTAMQPLEAMAERSGGNAVSHIWTYAFDTQLSNEEQIRCTDSLGDLLSGIRRQDADDVPSTIFYEGVASNRDDFYATYGGLFFLGVLLSVGFSLAAVLIIYYKQISEGYEDEARFAIMQKVGMTRGDIRRSVNSQMLLVFFLPLLLAGLHLCFAFPFVHKLLMLFNLNNVKLLIGTTALSYVVFALLYTLAYRLTSNAYYQIVSGARED